MGKIGEDKNGLLSGKFAWKNVGPTFYELAKYLP